jgi:hypothetical protein
VHSEAEEEKKAGNSSGGSNTYMPSPKSSYLSNLVISWAWYTTFSESNLNAEKSAKEYFLCRSIMSIYSCVVLN